MALHGSTQAFIGNRTVATSNPVAPATGDILWRTDRLIEYVYDGTRWLSTHLFTAEFPGHQVLQSISATTSRIGNVPFLGQYDIYAERLAVSYYVSTTTAANFFVAQLKKGDGASSTDVGGSASSQNITQNQWVTITAAINEVIATSSAIDELEVVFTETGTCTAFVAASISYRLVG